MEVVYFYDLIFITQRFCCKYYNKVTQAWSLEDRDKFGLSVRDKQGQFIGGEEHLHPEVLLR